MQQRPDNKDAPSLTEDSTAETFRVKYNHFLTLLDSDAELARLISDLEVKLDGRQLFGIVYIRTQTSRAVFHALRMLRSFEQLADKPLPSLAALINAIRDRFRRKLEVDMPLSGGRHVLSLSEVNGKMVDAVGGKSANLGEIRNGLGLPIPPGFAITTSAFRAFFSSEGLFEEIEDLKLEIAQNSMDDIRSVSKEIQSLVRQARIPDEIADEIMAAHARLAAEVGVKPGDLRVAIRSSAVGEDSELSYAGQYLSVLGVTAEGLLDAYKAVVASLYSPQVMAYRLLKGIRDDDVAMGVACLVMVPARAAGVMYTREPRCPEQDMLLINALWGLGPYAVDGFINPDTFRVARSDGAIRERAVADKPVRLEMDSNGGVAQRSVEKELRQAPSLSDEDIKRLATWGMALERHYDRPQDIEWAVDMTGRLMLLQSRPQPSSSPERAAHCQTRPAPPPEPGYVVVAEGGESACTGVGAGPAYHVLGDRDLQRFPKGAVLVAPHSSPAFIKAMKLASAIVTDQGSATGHMAALSWEFKLPTIVGIASATSLLTPGEVFTVDADARRIYQGRVESLLSPETQDRFSMKGTQVHDLLRRCASWITPLNLLDPRSPRFAPAYCTTIHDVMRLLHEWSYQEMFRTSEMVAGEPGMTVQLDATTGLDLHLIDLGGGLKPEAQGKPKAALAEIASRPFRAFLDGLVLHGNRARVVRPFSVRGLLSILARQLTSQPGFEGRLGGKSYALISDKYLNFSSRMGYHYGVLDCYCGQTLNKNYISFSFKGGAADLERRERRAKAIAEILCRLGFDTETVGDHVAGRLRKFEPGIIEEKLRALGRLMHFARQADMLMDSDARITDMVECFFSGEYCFDPGAMRSKLPRG